MTSFDPFLRIVVAVDAVSGKSSPLNGLLSAMVGKTWSQFIAQDRSPADSRSNSKSYDCENMKLKKEDIPIFGLCPARDQFYVTKCDHCGQVVKYQALAHHMESRHSQAALVGIETPPSSTRSESSGSMSSLSNNLITCDQEQQSSSAFAGLETEYSNVTISRLTPSPPATDSPIDPPAAPLSLHPSGTSTALCINISSMSITSSSSSSSSSNHLVNSHNNHTSSSDCALPDVTISAQQQDCLTSPPDASAGISLLKSAANSVKLKVSGVSSSTNTPESSLTAALLTPPAAGTKSKKSASSSSSSSNLLKEKLLPCKDRQYDPDKHCGARTENMDKSCTRSLTCKTHSLSMRRQVTGRSKAFDDLLEEHRIAKEEAMRLAGKEVKLTKKQIKQREQEAKKALAALQKQDKPDSKSTILSPASSSRPSPASSPCVAGRQLSSSAQPFVSSLPSPAAASTSGSQTISSPSSMKQSVQNNLTAKIKRKERDDLEQLLQQQTATEVRVNGDGLNADLPPPPPLTPIRNNLSLPLIIRPVDKRSRYEGPDGIDYLKYPPRPLAVNTYNTRIRNLTNSRTFDPMSISSRLYSRESDATYAEIRKVFQLSLQENSATTATIPQSSTKSKKKKSNASSNNTTSLKLVPSETAGCSVQYPASSSEFDQTVNMAPPVTNSLPNIKNNTAVCVSTTAEQHPALSGKKRPAPLTSISSATPSLTSLLESGTSCTSSLTVSLGFGSSFSPGSLTGSASPGLNGSLVDPPTISPVPKRLRTSDPLSPSASIAATSGTYALSAPSLESLLDAGIGSRTPIRSLSNESSTHSILSATLESGFNPAILGRVPDVACVNSPAAMAATPKAKTKSSNVQNSPHLISLLDSRPACDVTSAIVGVTSGLRSQAAVTAAFNKKVKPDPKLSNSYGTSYGIRQKVAPGPNSS